MTAVTPAALTRAVSVVCQDIGTRVDGTATWVWTEEDLREELACCVLSSQVPYDMARAASVRLRRSGLLDPERSEAAAYEAQIESALTAPLLVGSRLRRYRFPRTRARQLATTFLRLANGTSLKDELSRMVDPATCREDLMRLVAGFGPKQASMFLRNTGRSYDLAIVDRHVLRFMELIGLDTLRPAAPLTRARYELLEVALREYANGLGWPIGYLDWAVWIVMKAAREEGLA